MTLQNNIKYIQQTKTYMVSCVQIHQTIMNTSKQIKTHHNIKQNKAITNTQVLPIDKMLSQDAVHLPIVSTLSTPNQSIPI